jgi:hypothetical protein
MGLSVGSLAAPAARFEAPRLARPGPGVAVHRGGGRTARRPPAITAVLTAFLPAGLTGAAPRSPQRAPPTPRGCSAVTAPRWSAPARVAVTHAALYRVRLYHDLVVFDAKEQITHLAQPHRHQATTDRVRDEFLGPGTKSRPPVWMVGRF